MEKGIRKYIGTRKFYAHAMAIAIPMILQNLITNFVSMLDNIMVGQIGTAPMSGVSIANQLIFVFNITVFGGVSGASIFGTQFFGKKDKEGQKYTFRFRILMAFALIAVFASVFYFAGKPLLSLFISKNDAPELRAETLAYGLEYLRIMIIGLIPFAFGQAYASVVRECGETKVPMIGSMAAIGVNLVLDYGLIFGKLGMPCLGVKGAAIATVVAKTVEALVVIIWTHTNYKRIACAQDLYKSLRIPGALARKIVVKGVPLLCNEFLWSLGMSIIAQCYSVRGLDVVAARNIAGTMINLFNVFFIQMGAAIGIIVGAKLGANELEEARRDADKLNFFSVAVTAGLTLIMIPVAYVFPKMYNTEADIRALATYFILVQAIALPMWSYTNACYFILRSGGRTGITFLFDFIYTWVVMIPLAFVLANFTSLEIHMLFVVVTFSEIIKVIVGYFMVKSGIWVQNIVKGTDA
ncbi:MAG: MATE family efflux transporter [Saccharofermentans sp.]|nr:MATE family efflux transporter [Saccharofermentans sp.]